MTVDAAAFTVVDRTTLPWQPGMNAVHPDGRIYVTGFNAGVGKSVISRLLNVLTRAPSWV